jgi:hypothetical protein
MSMTANDPVQLSDTGAASSKKADAKVGHMKVVVGEQVGHAAHTVKDKTGEFAAKAHTAVTSEKAKPVARRSGAGGASLAVAALVIWAWRRHSRRNASPWEKAVRQTRTQVKVARGQAKAKAKVAQGIAQEKVANAKSRAKFLR